MSLVFFLLGILLQDLKILKIENIGLMRVPPSHDFFDSPHQSWQGFSMGGGLFKFDGGGCQYLGGMEA